MAHFLSYRWGQRWAEPYPLAIMERLFNGDDLIHANRHTGRGVEGETSLANRRSGTAARDERQCDATDDPLVFAMECFHTMYIAPERKKPACKTGGNTHTQSTASPRLHRNFTTSFTLFLAALLFLGGKLRTGLAVQEFSVVANLNFRRKLLALPIDHAGDLAG